MIALLSAFAHGPAEAGPEHVPVFELGEISGGRRKKIEKQLGHVEFRPGMHLVQFVPREQVPWSEIESALEETWSPPDETRPEDYWMTQFEVLRGLDDLRPPAHDEPGRRLQGQLAATLAFAQEQTGETRGLEDRWQRVGHLGGTYPQLPPSLNDRIQEEVEKAQSLKRFPVKVGSGAVLWEGAPLEKTDGTAQLPMGIWDLAGMEEERRTWTSRVQIGSKVDVERALEDLLALHILEPMAGDPCVVEVGAVPARWVSSLPEVVHVARGKYLWSWSDTAFRRNDRKCQR